MKITKRVATDECEIQVTVEAHPHQSETLVGFENRLVDIANKLIMAPHPSLLGKSSNED